MLCNLKLSSSVYTALKLVGVKSFLKGTSAVHYETRLAGDLYIYARE